jgi:hypothetical protein
LTLFFKLLKRIGRTARIRLGQQVCHGQRKDGENAAE